MNIVLFDGICNLCNASVRFITRHDKNNTIQFASLQSETSKELLLKMKIDSQKIDSIIFISNEKMFIKSDAAIEIAKLMDGFPRLLKYFQFIPRPIRDYVYDMIAKNRYRLFGKTCSLQPSNQNK
ncbi:MAG: thiol-disulfide oxidoreductase DCC family protein [bacterium]